MAEPPEQPEIIADFRELIGVWADQALVTYSIGGCTFDFVRIDSLVPTRAILVARVTLSAYEAERLPALVDAAVADYTEISLRKELDDRDQDSSGDAG